MNRVHVAILLSSLALSGCAGTATMTGSDGRVWDGTYDAISKTLAIRVDGADYRGHYVTNSTLSTGAVQTASRTPSFSTGVMSTSGSQGRAILQSADGRVIQCEFMYQGLNAVGSCEDATGKKYSLSAHQ